MNISLSFWIKKTNQNQAAVFGIHDGGLNDLVFFVDEGGVGNRVKLICGNDLGTISTGVEFTNTWRHVGLVMEQDEQAKLYIDGTFIGDFPNNSCDTEGFGDSDEMIFGGELDGANGLPTDDYYGYLSEFRIYDSVLTAANIQSLYNLPTGIPSSTNISGDQISTGKLKSSNWSSTAGSNFDLDGGTFKLGGSSNPKLEWDGTSLSVTGNITVSNPNDFADANADDSTTSAVFNKVVSPTSQILASDGRPAGFFAAYNNNVKTTIQSSIGGDGIRRLMLYSSTDTHMGMCTNAVEIQNGATYKISMKFKANSADSDGLYVRVYELDALTGTDDYGTNCSFNEGTLKGISHQSSLLTGEEGIVQNTRQKSTSFTNAADGSTYDVENGPVPDTYVTIEATYTPTSTAKLFSVNVLNWSGMGTKQLFVEDLQVIPLGVAQGTQIGGDSIRTGLIKSLNLGPLEGSIINLDTGSMLMGGTTNPGFEVTKEGFVTATNLVEKSVIVTDANSGSYFETFNSASTDWTRLVLDGSAGGDVTMNMTLESVPPYVISDLKFPTNASIDSIAKLELQINTSSVQFNEGAVSSGYGLFIQKQYTNSGKTLSSPPSFN